jgi:hypothetical protein
VPATGHCGAFWRAPNATALLGTGSLALRALFGATVPLVAASSTMIVPNSLTSPSSERDAVRIVAAHARPPTMRALDGGIDISEHGRVGRRRRTFELRRPAPGPSTRARQLAFVTEQWLVRARHKARRAPPTRVAVTAPRTLSNALRTVTSMAR